MLIGIVGWLVVGLVVGFLASKLVNLRGDDPRLSIGVAVAGALVAAFLYSVISGDTIRAWGPWSLMFAAIGGIVGAIAWHAVRSRSISRDRYVPRRSY